MLAQRLVVVDDQDVQRCRRLHRPQTVPLRRVRGRACDPPARHAHRGARGRSSRAIPARSASTRAGRRSTTASTSATRGPFVVYSPAKRVPRRTRATRRRSWPTSPTSTTRSTTRRGAPACPSAQLAREMTARYVARHRRPRASGAPTTSRWPARRSDAIVALIEALLEGGHAYAADGDVYFRVRSDAAYGVALAPRRSTTWTRARGSRARSARRTRSTSRSGRRRSRARTRPGTRRGAAGGRAGTSSARRWPRSCSASASTSTAAATTWSSPTTRTRPRRRAAPAAPSSPAIWMHNGMLQIGAEKMAKSVGNIALLADALEQLGPRRARAVLPLGPLPPAAAVSDETPASRRSVASRGCARPGGALGRGPSPPELAPLTRALLRRAGRRLRHPGGARRGLSSWVREANAAPTAASDRRRRPARDARRARRSRTCSTPRRPTAGRTTPRSTCCAAAQAARAARDFAEADRLRDELAALGWQVRDGADGARLVRA